ncbi:MAG: insulinase family protein, partial [Chthoniobacterales bacterium]|nr:insulinase family protein [Chthoniobacterales bacterium]
VNFPEQPFAKDYTIDSEIPKGTLQLFWPTDDGIEAPRSRRLNLLGAVVSDRLRVQVREEIGGSYSPGAGSNASDTFPGYGYMVANIDVDPATAAKMSDLVVSLGNDMAEKGVTDDELERARLPLLTALRESLRSNAYWLNAVVSRAQEKPVVLDWARTRLPDVESITTKEINELAKKYLGRDRASKVVVLPKAKDPAGLLARPDDT